MYPLKFRPIYQEKIWGGRSLGRKLARELPAGLIGESWELSCHGDDISVVANGSSAGLSLKELIAEKGPELLGEELVRNPDFNPNSVAGEIFPLLLKIIDARDNLSVQVHPDDDYAAENEAGSSGKTELWYILNAEPGARIIYGLKPGIGQEEFREAVEGSRIQETLNEVKVRAGDYFYIPAGTVHAIGKGVMLAEIQQNSDLTYRVYDWDRVDEAGNSRELHLEKAFEAIDFGQGQQSQGNYSQDLVNPTRVDSETQLVSSKFFNVRLVNLCRRYARNTKGRRFYIYLNLGSQVKVNYPGGSLEVARGQSFMIPAGLGKYELVGRSRLLQVFIS